MKRGFYTYDDLQAVRSDSSTSNWAHGTYREGVFTDTITVQHKTYVDQLYLEFDVLCPKKKKNVTWRIDYIKTGMLKQMVGAAVGEPVGRDENSKAVANMIDCCVKTFARIKHAGDLK